MIYDYDWPYDEVDQLNYYFFDKAFDEDELATIEAIADTYEFDTAVTEGQEKDSDHLKNVRHSKIKWIRKNEDSLWLYDKIGEMAVEANNAIYKFDLKAMKEDIQYTVYPKDAGHYDWHMDIGSSGLMMQRKLSCTIELTEHGIDYEGGKLQANKGNGITELPQGKGTAVFFPSFFVHRVTPVTMGERKSLVLWIGGDHYR